MLCVCAHVAARGTPQTSLEKTAGGEGRQDESLSALQAHLRCRVLVHTQAWTAKHHNGTMSEPLKCV